MSAANIGVRVTNRVQVQVQVRVRVTWFVVTGTHTGGCVYGSVAEEGGSEAVCGLWLEGRLCSMLTVMLGGDLDDATRV